MKIWTGIAPGFYLAALVGCAGSQQMAKVDDSGLARLNETQMQPVDDARIEEGRARDGVAKATANEQEARSRVEVARSEREVADAQLKRATAERDMLKGQYAERDAIGRAENDIAAVKQRIQAADLKLSYLTKMVAVAESEHKVAMAHVTTAAAVTEQSKLKAMRAANAPQVASVNSAAIDERLAQAQAAEAQIKAQTAQQRSAAVEDYNRWQDLDARARTLAQPDTSAVPPPAAPSEPTK